VRCSYLLTIFISNVNMMTWRHKGSRLTAILFSGPDPAYRTSVNAKNFTKLQTHEPLHSLPMIPSTALPDIVTAQLLLETSKDSSCSIWLNVSSGELYTQEVWYLSAVRAAWRKNIGVLRFDFFHLGHFNCTELTGGWFQLEDLLRRLQAWHLKRVVCRLQMPG
jgi:hypothetical protein